jgi:superfamily II DNA or RNA helicase
MILVLHAAVHDERLAVWGEVPVGATGAAPDSCSATHDVLRDALQRAAIAADGEERMLIAWLPAVGGRPVPSSPLIGEAPDAPHVDIVPWRIDAIELHVGDAIELLAAAAGKRLVAPGVLVGADLAFCVTAMRFAATLVARGHVLPSVEETGNRWRAHWIAAPTAAEHEQIASLARAMPSAAVAIGISEEAPPAADRRHVIDRFLNDVIDHFMRRAEANAQQPKPQSLHDRWLAALASRDGALTGDAADLAQLRDTLAEWRRPVAEQSLFDFRLAFRLEEPPEGEEAWTIHFLLQGISDPSLLVPLSLIRNPKLRGDDAAAARRLLRGRGDAQRFILSSLARAAAISKGIDEALRHGEPSEVATDTTGAFAFLTNDAAALQSSGFGVLLPSWWTRKGTKKRLSVRAEARSPKFESATGLTLGALIDVRWRVALGDEVLSMAELRALARMKMPLVRIRGQWVQLRPEEIEEAIRFARAKAEKLTVGEVLRMDLTQSAARNTSLEVTGIDGDAPIATLLARLEGHREWEEVPPPRGFSGTLRPYQQRGYSWLDFHASLGLGACLADDMGLGKTVQTLALLQKQWLSKKQPALLICPTSVTGNWIREAARFTPSLPVLLHHGADRMRGKQFIAKAKKSALVVSSYALLTRDTELLGKVPWRTVILDEAQNVKNSETRQAKAARSIEAPFRVALTGTPVENNIGDLWSIIDFLNPGYLGTAAQFRKRYFLPIQTSRDADAIEELRRLTQPFILRRLKTDRSIIADLPQKNEMKVFCTLTKEQASLYEAVVKDAEEAIADAKGIGRRGLILATITRLKQVCNHPRQLLNDRSAIDGRSGKLARLTEMLSEAVEGGDAALVFTQFAEMGTILQTHLQEQLGSEVLFLHGATPRAKRETMIERFQKSDGPPIFVLSLKAGGTGLNLTRANHVFHFDRWWNPAVENQATDRAFRIGQTRPVQVHKFICGGTFEEKIDAMIEAKLELATTVVGAGEAWLTELSNRELRDLFTLRADAIGE